MSHKGTSRGKKLKKAAEAVFADWRGHDDEDDRDLDTIQDYIDYLEDKVAHQRRRAAQREEMLGVVRDGHGRQLAGPELPDVPPPTPQEGTARYARWQAGQARDAERAQRTVARRLKKAGQASLTEAIGAGILPDAAINWDETPEMRRARETANSGYGSRRLLGELRPGENRVTILDGPGLPQMGPGDNLRDYGRTLAAEERGPIARRR